MQKEQYEALEMETVVFDTEDVIRTSPVAPPNAPGYDDWLG